MIFTPNVYTQEFEFTPSDLTEGTSHLSIMAQREMRAPGPVSGPLTGVIRVQLGVDNSARCAVVLCHQGKPVYTAWYEVGSFIGPAGLSRVTDVTNGVRWLLQALFEGGTLLGVDLEALTEWAYQEVFGRPMK